MCSSWSVQELLQAGAIFAHYHSLCGLVFGQGIREELLTSEVQKFWDGGPASKPTFGKDTLRSDDLMPKLSHASSTQSYQSEEQVINFLKKRQEDPNGADVESEAASYGEDENSSASSQDDEEELQFEESGKTGGAAGGKSGKVKKA